jgi:hypothetical protein
MSKDWKEGHDRLMDQRAFIGGLALVTIVVPRAATSRPSRI